MHLHQAAMQWLGVPAVVKSRDVIDHTHMTIRCTIYHFIGIEPLSNRFRDIRAPAHVNEHTNENEKTRNQRTNTTDRTLRWQ